MSLSNALTYTVTFLALYVQVFFFVTFLEKRKELKSSPLGSDVTDFPSVAVIVPCWNEERTVHGTVESLLALDYPKDKLEIVIVDDGSTDGTWQAISKYQNHPQIKVFTKENGGKHTAVNFGIDHTTADFIGCLDADSFVSSHALRDMIAMFQADPELMAIAPTLVVSNPRTPVQWAQKVEYNMSVYLKKMQAMLNAIHVTPGPFSVFRKEVFQRIGKFKKAHNTEDQEIAYRMQENHMRIGHCHTAYVYTTAPDTVKKLYKQRVRWIYGFIQNSVDYRRLIFNKDFGNFSFFTLPAGVISIVTAVFLFFTGIYNLLIFVIKRVTMFSVVGLGLSTKLPNFDWFYFNIKTTLFTTLALYSMILVSIFVGARIAKQKVTWHIFWFLFVYSVIAPFWLIKAVFSSVISKKPNWR